MAETKSFDEVFNDVLRISKENQMKNKDNELIASTMKTDYEDDNENADSDDKAIIPSQEHNNEIKDSVSDKIDVLKQSLADKFNNINFINKDNIMNFRKDNEDEDEDEDELDLMLRSQASKENIDTKEENKESNSQLEQENVEITKEFNEQNDIQYHPEKENSSNDDDIISDDEITEQPTEQTIDQPSEKEPENMSIFIPSEDSIKTEIKSEDDIKEEEGEATEPTPIVLEDFREEKNKEADEDKTKEVFNNITKEEINTPETSEQSMANEEPIAEIKETPIIETHADENVEDETVENNALQEEDEQSLETTEEAVPCEGFMLDNDVISKTYTKSFNPARTLPLIRSVLNIKDAYRKIFDSAEFIAKYIIKPDDGIIIGIYTSGEKVLTNRIGFDEFDAYTGLALNFFKGTTGCGFCKLRDIFATFGIDNPNDAAFKFARAYFEDFTHLTMSEMNDYINSLYTDKNIAELYLTYDGRCISKDIVKKMNEKQHKDVVDWEIFE